MAKKVICYLYSDRLHERFGTCFYGSFSGSPRACSHAKLFSRMLDLISHVSSRQVDSTTYAQDVEVDCVTMADIRVAIALVLASIHHSSPHDQHLERNLLIAASAQEILQEGELQSGYLQCAKLMSIPC
jgi:hypothetical protein